MLAEHEVEALLSQSEAAELGQAGETGIVGCIVGAVVIDVNGQGSEGRPTDFRIEEHLQVADRRTINPYLGGRQILGLRRFTAPHLPRRLVLGIAGYHDRG
jgi:hypothetical protein